MNRPHESEHFGQKRRVLVRSPRSFLPRCRVSTYHPWCISTRWTGLLERLPSFSRSRSLLANRVKDSTPTRKDLAGC